MQTTLSDRLKAAMEIPPGHSAADLARACRVKAPSVSGWLSGESKKMDAANLLTVARLCKVSPDWLCFGTGKMKLVDPWPFELFTPDEYELIPHDYRRRVESELAGEVLRAKKRQNGTIS